MNQNTPSTQSPDNLLDRNATKLNWLDYVFAPLIALAAAIWTFPNVGTTINWDDLLYMDLSQYTTPETWILNRYGHIYLQKFFFFLCRDAITGTRVYWCFLFFATTVLIYFCVRLLTGKKGFLLGPIAALFFMAQPLFARQIGCTLADFTVMFLVTLSIFIYIAFLNHGKYRKLVIVILGLLFFWATKSKETGVTIGILFFALGFNSTGSWRLKNFIKEVAYVFLGMAVGCLLLMTLDLASMGDFLFSVRPSNFLHVLDVNFGIPGETQGPYYAARPLRSWFMYFSKMPLFTPFFLYVLVGWRNPERQLTDKEKIAWLFPLTMVLFLTFIRSSFVVLPRYFAPAVPAVCIWASLFFQFDLTGPKISLGKNLKIPRIIAAIAFIVLAFVLVAVVMHFLPAIRSFYKRPKELSLFYAVAIIPPATIILFATAGLSQKRRLTALLLSFFALFLLLWMPLDANISAVKQGKVAQRSRWRFEPYRAFADEFTFEKDTKILVSQSVHKQSWMLGRDVRGHRWTFNVFFNQKFNHDQFVDATLDDIINTDYTFALITFGDWKQLVDTHKAEQIQKKYIVKPNKQLQLILLKKP